MIKKKLANYVRLLLITLLRFYFVLAVQVPAAVPSTNTTILSRIKTSPGCKRLVLAGELP